MRKEMQLNTVDGSIHYTVAGNGRPVMLLHGFGEDSDVWKYQLRALSPFYRIILPDLPGSGLSPFHAGNGSMEKYAAQLIAILDKENIEKFVLIGHSMGGYITLAFASKYPEKLDAFGLFHSTAYPDSAEKIATRQRGIEFIRTHGSKAFLQQSTPNLFSENYRNKHTDIINGMITQYEGFEPGALIEYYEAMIGRKDRTAVLRTFEKPVLFIIGKQDTAISPEQMLQQSHLPQISYIHFLENSGHMGMWEETAKANDALKTFLDGVYIN
jgi:pimeloyl-ACP methyl ester carboxylesterase